MKILINSVPKSGTYLTGNLLNEFGFKFSRIHFNQESYVILTDLEIKHQQQYRPSYPHINQQVLGFVKDNHYCMGHLSVDYAPLFKDYKKIILTRNYEDANKSLMRMKARTTNLVPQDLEKLPERSLITFCEEWRDVDNTFFMTFEELTKPNIQKLNKLQVFLFDELLYDRDQCIRNALDAPSYTKSDLRI
jgi:hypothetical protein